VRPVRCGRESVVDLVLARLLQPGQSRAHRLDGLVAVPRPFPQLADHANRVQGAEGAGGVAGESLVGHVGIVLELPRRLHHVDAGRALALGQLGTPGGGGASSRRVEGGAGRSRSPGSSTARVPCRKAPSANTSNGTGSVMVSSLTAGPPARPASILAHAPEGRKSMEKAPAR